MCVEDVLILLIWLHMYIIICKYMCILNYGTAQVQGNVRTQLRCVLNVSCTRIEHILTHPACISNEAKKMWLLIKFGMRPCHAVLR